MTSPLLEIQDLHIYFKTYDGILKVLPGVDFTVGKREKIGIIGETGCGKTTPMRAVLRILSANARIPKGRILLEGKDILEMTESEMQRVRRERISMIFQDPTAALNPVFKVGEQVMDVIKYSGKGTAEESLSKKEIKRKAIRVLKEVALPDPERIMKNYPFQLSGGMRQRICIAMSLVSARDLLIADEPTSSLDVSIQDQILRLLEDLVKKKHTSIVLISHSLGVVKSLAEKIYVMYAGSVVENAKMEDIFSEPLHPYTRGLLRAIPKLAGGSIFEGLRGRIPNYLNPPKGCRFFPRCDHAMPICKENKPPLFNVRDAHKVACFLYGGD